MTATSGTAPRVLAAAALPDRFIEPLTAAGMVVTCEPDADCIAFTQALEVADGLLLGTNVRVDAALIALAPHLRAISTISVGLDHIDLEAAARRGITVTTTPVLSDAVADLTMALLLAVARRVPAAADAARSNWSAAPTGSDLRDKTMFLVGFGRIGQEVARRAAGFKMQVTYFDPRPVEAPPGAAPVATIADGLRSADVVSLHVDLNPTTTHLIDREALATMKRTAILINTSRGGVVDQAALTVALTDKRIDGAGLDVLEHEPPTADEPLLHMDNVVVVPHVGSNTRETRRAMLDTALDNLRRCLLGEPCAYVVQAADS